MSAVRISLNRKTEPEICSFLDFACPAMGDTWRAGIARFITSTEAFIEWRKKVGRCSHCGAFVAVNVTDGIATLDHHWIPNPKNVRPHRVTCPHGGKRPAVGTWPPSYSEIEACKLSSVLLEHAVSTFGPGYL